MGSFWYGWALWAQMGFILGCAIFATVAVGLIKLKLNDRKIRKHEKIDDQKRNDKQKEMAENPNPIDLELGAEVPFGVRAIESGIEVDGVWISRTNTPTPSSPATSICSGYPEMPGHCVRPFSESAIPRLDMPQPAISIPLASSRSSSREWRGSFDRAVNAEYASSSTMPQSLGVGPSTIASPSPSRYNMSSLPVSSISDSAESSDAYMSRTSRAQSVFAQIRRVSNNEYSDDISPTFLADGSGSDKETGYFTDQHDKGPDTPKDLRTDLDLLQSHRLTHVAETGQLTPRCRRHGHNMDSFITVDVNKQDIFDPDLEEPR